MTDIDFEELDKAVNSLMNQQQARSATPEATMTPTPVPAPIITPTSDSAPTAPPVAGESSSPSNRATSTQNLTVAARRPMGRFMDVVHPSSDMKTRAINTGQPSRVGQTIQPMNETIAPLPEAPGAAEVPPMEPVSEFNVAPKTETTVPTETISDVKLPEVGGSLLAAKDETIDPAPMSSPFLEGAVVEKRPLGSVDNGNAQIGTDSMEVTKDTMPDPIADWQPPVEEAPQLATIPEIEVTPTKEATPDISNDNPDQTKPAEEAPVQPLAPELSAEVLALESDAAQSLTGGGQSTTEHSTPGDIPKQYTSVDAGAPEPSAVFDVVADGPQPLQHPEKKKSGWRVVAWILGLLLIGAGGGVIAWFFLLK